MDICQNIYKSSRVNAKYTQESAADFLHISARTLGSYETGAAPVPDDIADRMVDLYKDELLGYQHLMMNPIARRFLPEIDRHTLSQAALYLICATSNYQAVQASMMMLAADGKIDKHEEAEWTKIQEAAFGVTKAVFGLRFASQD